MIGPGSACDFLRQIAVPRLAGSDAVADVEAVVVARLRSLGYAVCLQDFSTTARRLYAPSVAGAGLGWVALGVIPLLALPIPGWGAATAGLAALAVVALVAVGIAAGHLRVPMRQVEAANIIADHGVPPRLWLVAHSDSKAQTLSLRARVVAIGLASVGAAGITLCLVGRFAGPLPWWAFGPACLAALIGGGMLSLPPVRDASPGAVDNASGIIAVLAAAERLREMSDIGVLITGAEELGMEGARRFVATDARRGFFINFDGIDGHGTFNVMDHHSVADASTREVWARIRSGVVADLVGHGHLVRKSPLPFGVFVDGSVLAAGGMNGCTLSRGTWATLGVVHTKRDTAVRMDVEGALAAGTAVANTLTAVLG